MGRSDGTTRWDETAPIDDVIAPPVDLVVALESTPIAAAHYQKFM